MKTVKKAGIYSPISLAAINIIGRANPEGHRLLLAYMTLARYAGQKAVGGYAENQVTGAGANVIEKTLKIGRPRAKLLIDTLIKLNVIEKAPPKLVVGKSPATYVLMHLGDVQVPHALIDGLPNVTGINRICDVTHKASASVMVFAIIALVHCYRGHDMLRYGGISHNLISHGWKMSVQPYERGFKATAQRDGDQHPKGSLILFADVMASLSINSASALEWIPVFQQGINLLSTCGLIYEVVTLLDAQMNPILPIRINDYHAANNWDTEPTVNQNIHGASFYDSKTEANLWLYSPTDLRSVGAILLGISRMRFRGAEASTAIGLERDMTCVTAHKRNLIDMDIIDDIGGY
jgi:hypothetical protein